MTDYELERRYLGLLVMICFIGWMFWASRCKKDDL